MWRLPRTACTRNSKFIHLAYTWWDLYKSRLFLTVIIHLIVSPEKSSKILRDKALKTVKVVHVHIFFQIFGDLHSRPVLHIFLLSEWLFMNDVTLFLWIFEHPLPLVTQNGPNMTFCWTSHITLRYLWTAPDVGRRLSWYIRNGFFLRIEILETEIYVFSISDLPFLVLKVFGDKVGLRSWVEDFYYGFSSWKSMCYHREIYSKI